MPELWFCLIEKSLSPCNFSRQTPHFKRYAFLLPRQGAATAATLSQLRHLVIWDALVGSPKGDQVKKNSGTSHCQVPARPWNSTALSPQGHTAVTIKSQDLMTIILRSSLVLLFLTEGYMSWALSVLGSQPSVVNSPCSCNAVDVDSHDMHWLSCLTPELVLPVQFTAFQAYPWSLHSCSRMGCWPLMAEFRLIPSVCNVLAKCGSVSLTCICWTSYRCLPATATIQVYLVKEFKK